jgi:hypothetical protein
MSCEVEWYCKRAPDFTHEFIIHPQYGFRHFMAELHRLASLVGWEGLRGNEGAWVEEVYKSQYAFSGWIGSQLIAFCRVADDLVIDDVRYLNVCDFVVHPDHTLSRLDERFCGFVDIPFQDSGCRGIAIHTWDKGVTRSLIFHRLGFAAIDADGRYLKRC